MVVGSFGLGWAFVAYRTNPTRRIRPSVRVVGVGDADRGQVVWGNDALWGLLLDDDTDAFSCMPERSAFLADTGPPALSSHWPCVWNDGTVGDLDVDAFGLDFNNLYNRTRSASPKYEDESSHTSTALKDGRIQDRAKES